MSKDNIPFEELRKGDEVFLSHIRKRGILLEYPQGRKKVRVACNNVSLLVDVKNIGKGIKVVPKKRGKRITVTADKRCRIIQDYPTFDLHRLTVEEAIDRLSKFLDSAILNNIHTVRVIHGHGTGRLKRGVRAYLKDSPYVASFHPSLQHEGGDGVTIVELKE